MPSCYWPPRDATQTAVVGQLLRRREFPPHARDDLRRYDVRIVALLDLRDGKAHSAAIHSTLQICRASRGIEWQIEPLDVVAAEALEEQHTLTLAGDESGDR